SQSGEFGQTWSFRGTKSRNKVSVGEPAEGSLKKFNNFENGFFFFRCKDGLKEKGFHEASRA
ncbi:hypothetical protein PMV57_14495, partial [Eggerthella lenta]